MKQEFEAILTGSDTPIGGIVNKINYEGFDNAYEFEAIDHTLHLIIGKDKKGNWQRISGTEPYLISWVDELAQQVI